MRYKKAFIEGAPYCVIYDSAYEGVNKGEMGVLKGSLELSLGTN